MEKMGGILDHLFDRWNLKRPLREQGVFAVWDQVVGEALAAHAQPASIAQGRLLVTVSDPAWNSQLQFLKDDLKQKLNHLLGRSVVNDIRFRVGEVKSQARPAAKPEKPRPVLLEAGRLEEIEEAVAVIGDEELREMVRRYLMKVAGTGRDKE